MEKLYVEILKGNRLMLDNYHGMTLSPDGEFIRVQGSGSWAFRAEDKARFIEEAQDLSDKHASGNASDYSINKYSWQA